MSPSPSICLTDSFVSLCLPLFGPGCLPAWTPVTALWGGGVHLSPFVSLHLSPVVSQPGCLARLFGWTVSLVSLCLPSFGSRCLPAWMSVTALHADGFTCFPWFPFICLPSVGGRIDLCPFVSLYLSPVVSQPGCLSGWTDSFVSLCLALFVSRCLPAWMPGTALWVDGFICLPLSPSLDVWHSRSAVSFTSRGSVLLAGSGLRSASALASVIPCLVDVGDRVLCLPFIWTSILLGLVVGRLPCLSLATPCLFVQCLVISCGLSLSLLAFGVPS